MAGQTKKLTPSVPRAETIYASFSREEERAFLFPGGANPMAELLYVEQGSLHSVADGRKQYLQKGDFVIYGPNQWHMQYADIDTATSFFSVATTSESKGLSPNSTDAGIPTDSNLSNNGAYAV